MKTVSGSLAALAILALRNNQWSDVARCLTQAACAPDVETFLECELAENFQATCLVDSMSSASGLADSVAALSAALKHNAEEDLQNALYGDDDIVSLNSDSPEDDLDEDEEEEDDAEDSESTSAAPKVPASPTGLLSFNFED